MLKLKKLKHKLCRRYAAALARFFRSIDRPATRRIPPTAAPVMASAMENPVYSGVPTSLPAVRACTAMIPYKRYDVM